MTALLLLLVPVLIALLAAIFRWLWNTTMPDVFGLRAVTFWQAVRLLLIAAFLFGGIKYASDGTGESKAVAAKLDEANRKLEAINARLANLR